MSKVAVFVSRYGIGNSPSIINFLNLLSDHYEVDLYVRDVGMLDAPVLAKDSINVIPIRRRHVLAYWAKNSVVHSSAYEHFICFNPNAFVMCKEMFPRSRPIYYCLELHMSYDHKGLHYPPDVSRKERAWINDIQGLIIQSEAREKLFREDYELSDEIPTFYLPVTYSGEPCTEKSDYLREKHGIGPDKKILIQLGEIKWWFNCIDIARSVAGLEDWVLFIHGYYDWEYLEELKRVLRDEQIDNVIVSHDFIASIDELNEMIKSCDVGVAWYSDYTVNMKTVGTSSGKISAYLKFGLPVITNNYPTLVSAVEDKGCGVCLDDYDGIPFALSRISDNYESYSRNAITEYERTYRFSNYEETLLEFIESKDKVICGVR